MCQHRVNGTRPDGLSSTDTSVYFVSVGSVPLSVHLGTEGTSHHDGPRVQVSPVKFLGVVRHLTSTTRLTRNFRLMYPPKEKI